MHTDYTDNAIASFLQKEGLTTDNIDSHVEAEKLVEECHRVLAAKYDHQGQEIAHPSLDRETLLMSDARLRNDFDLSDKNWNDFLPSIIIDAGGTNLRIVVLQKKDDSLQKNDITPVSPHQCIEFAYYQKTKIPGSTGSVTAKQFFQQLFQLLKPALNLPVASAIDTIRFCFSYPSTFDEQDHARVGTLSKEISIVGLAGMRLDQELKNEINTTLGYQRIRQIIVLNDTTATLLASLADEITLRQSPHYDTRLGIVLGTGYNIAYMEKHLPSTQQKDWPRILNTEVGNYPDMPRNKIDLLLEAASKNPGKGRAEKSISGSYLGIQATLILRHAIEEKLLPKSLEQSLGKNWLRSEDLDTFITGHNTSKAGKQYRIPHFATSLTKALLKLPPPCQATAAKLIEALINRASLLAAVSTSALVAFATRNQLDNENGKKQHRKNQRKKHSLLSLNGSVMFRAPGFQDRFLHHLNALESFHHNRITVKAIDRAPILGCLFAQKAID